MKLDDKLLTILKKYKTIQYNPGEVIFSNNDKCDSIGIILSGSVKISTITYLEKEEIINTLEPGEIFGNILIFSKQPTYLGDIISEKKTSIVLITKHELIELLQSDSYFLELYLSEQSNTALDIKQQNKLLLHKNIKDRILYYFSILSIKQKTKIITIPNITKLSKILSLPRPSVSRELTKLENEVLIKKDKNIITLFY